MKAVTLGVRPLADSSAGFSSVWRSGKREASARISFATPELLWGRYLRKSAGMILKTMVGQGAISLREAARRVGRNVKSVPGDVQALLDAGVPRRTDGGEIEFPYDAVRVEFTLRAA